MHLAIFTEEKERIQAKGARTGGGRRGRRGRRESRGRSGRDDPTVE